MSKNNAEIKALKGTISVSTDSLDNLGKAIDDNKTVKSRYEKLKELRVKLNSKILDLQTQLDFYESNEECPVCHQDIDTEFKEQTVCNHNEKIVEIREGIEKLQEELDGAENRLEEIAEIQQQIISVQNDIQQNQFAVNTLTDANTKLYEENNSLNDSKGSRLSLIHI